MNITVGPGLMFYVYLVVPQVTVHAEIQLHARRLFEGLVEWIVQKPIYLVDFATFDVPTE